MASGRKNYFRHSFFAHNDIKLKMLRDEIGVGFYFYFFSLLEQCGGESADELQEQYVFHDSTIRSLWGVNLKKSERIAYQMNAVGLLEFEKREKTFVFRIPNFAKYLGKYVTKTSPNFLKKEKEKKRKERVGEIQNALPCAICDDTGRLLKKNFNTGVDRVFSCVCDVGITYEKNFPRWEDAINKEVYEPPIIRED